MVSTHIRRPHRFAVGLRRLWGRRWAAWSTSHRHPSPSDCNGEQRGLSRSDPGAWASAEPQATAPCPMVTPARRSFHR